MYAYFRFAYGGCTFSVVVVFIVAAIAVVAVVVIVAAIAVVAVVVIVPAIAVVVVVVFIVAAIAVVAVVVVVAVVPVVGRAFCTFYSFHKVKINYLTFKCNISRVNGKYPWFLATSPPTDQSMTHTKRNLESQGSSSFSQCAYLLDRLPCFNNISPLKTLESIFK